MPVPEGRQHDRNRDAEQRAGGDVPDRTLRQPVVRSIQFRAGGNLRGSRSGHDGWVGEREFLFHDDDGAGWAFHHGHRDR